jgi:prevent-host-death family protein
MQPMSTDLLNIDAMPQQSASHAKNRWAELVRRVRENGSVAITNHSKVEMVVVEATRYKEMTDQLQAARRRDQTMLDELTKRFDARLAVLQQPDAWDKLESMMRSDGKLDRPPRAGESF